ncbi:MAG: tetratricopeptide repeat protein [Limisphaerales bacterium]
MKAFACTHFRGICAAALLATVTGLSGQAAKSGVARSDTPKLESSGAAALIARGRELEAAGQTQSAAQFYRQALLMQDAEGAFHLGRLEWRKAAGATGRLRLRRERTALEWWFRAATNGHAAACQQLAECFRSGLGVAPDRAQAYAWLRLAREWNAELSLEQLDELVLELSPAEIEYAQTTVRAWRAGQWPAAIAPALVENDPRWRLTGITTGSRTTIMVNKVTLTQGDAALISPWTTVATGRPATSAPPVVVRCETIGPDFALLVVAGEPDRILIPLDAR